MEKEFKLSDIQIKEARINMDVNIQEIRRMNQQIAAWHKDIEENIQNIKLELEIRKLSLKVDQLTQENKVYQKRLRTGKEVVDKLETSDINKFEEEKAKEK